MQEVFEQQDIQEDSIALGAVKDHNTGWYTDITALSRAPVVRELSSDKKGTGKRSTNVCGSGTSLLTNVIIKTTTNSRGAAIRQDLKGADGALQNGVAKTGGAKKIHKTLLGPSK